MQFIFLCANGDIAFANAGVWYPMLAMVKENKDKTFLLQSKNPAVFKAWEKKLPDNLIIGTTIETNRIKIAELTMKMMIPNERLLYNNISKAPHPYNRIYDFARVQHPLKMLTYEPVLNFDVGVMVAWAERIKPCMIWLGYDSKPKQNKLPEPPLSKVRELHWELAKRGFVVILKTIRKAWWEK